MAFFAAADTSVYCDQLALFNIKCRFLFGLAFVVIVQTQCATSFRRSLFKWKDISHTGRIPYEDVRI